MTSITRGRGLHASLQPWSNPRVYHQLRSQLQPVCVRSSLLFSTSASSQQSRRPSPSSPSSSVPSTSIVTAPSKIEVNAPSSTFPADIVDPAPVSPSTGLPGKLKRFVEIGRIYLTFYKTGLKNVYRNYRVSIPLRKVLGLPVYLPVSPPRTISQNNAPSTRKESVLGRAQFQLVCRSARDVRRMIPFTMILIVCGEFTPLIVPIFGSAITPATCRVPSQVEKERVSATKIKMAALDVHVTASKDASLNLLRSSSEEQLHLLAKQFADPVWAASADPASVLRAAAVFGLAKRHDRAAGTLLAGIIYRPRLARHIEYLSIDDEMIHAGGGVRALNAAEVRIAVEERGGVDVSASAKDRKQAENVERRWLEQWLSIRGGGPKSKKQ
ncbi:hypothetical protein N7508_005650 [Penicillium antarcticum]|uniref:uncharacterized protein n=1 Tax=Penicillium antarcticum TaxID=416450 RepID=UPI002389457A|nr:uncharacterized protein N7508_005650 [Penicillium antarcticum]KAJ5306635.1 hypothetical protein N7508_005650 [Penicillium antarcticum]